MNLTVRAAKNPEELQAIFDLRYRILRAPWNQPASSASDELENVSVNAFSTDEHGKVIACGRLQENAGSIGQIRYMAVREDAQGKGLGKKILDFLESEGRKMNLNKIQLQARENALQFYLSQHYRLVEPSFKLWGQIQHYLMEKDL